ncbi:MAG: PD-(D/E)XK nuclease family protein, partial [bacterium]|nr:PD-(D/E)XK nuclease family protein [bacterium]
MMDLPRGYISYSQIRTYQTCPKMYYYSYVERIKTPVNDKILLGIVFHAVVEYCLKEKINGKIPAKEE